MLCDSIEESLVIDREDGCKSICHDNSCNDNMLAERLGGAAECKSRAVATSLAQHRVGRRLCNGKGGCARVKAEVAKHDDVRRRRRRRRGAVGAEVNDDMCSTRENTGDRAVRKYGQVTVEIRHGGRRGRR